MPSMRFPALALVTAVWLLGCQGSSPMSGRDDGYFTWVDEQGRVRQTVIPRGNEEKAADGQAANDQQEGDRKGETRAEADDPKRNSQGSRGEFNLQNYPDGNELEKAGFIRPGDPLPYFTWRDAAGNVRVSYFTPDTRTDVEKGLVRPPLRLTPSSTYRPEGPGVAVSSGVTPDPVTLAVLGVEQDGRSWIERWTDQCCESLDTRRPVNWQAGREFRVVIDQGAPRHDFHSGSSHFRLVRLPDATENPDFVLRLRSFAEDETIFNPSVAFLDKDLNTLRVVTDLVHEFVPESWYRYPYLQSHIPVFPGEGERWAVIFTRDEDLAGQTVSEEKGRPQAFQHVETGLLSVSAVTQE